MKNKNKSDAILKYMNEHLDEFTEKLLDFVKIESPGSGDKKYGDAIAEYAAGLFSDAGCRTEIIPVKEAGNMMRAEIGSGEETIMLVGHADTVFPAGTTGTEMFPRIEDGKLYGPGAFDMKGGVLSMAFAIKALLELGMFPDRHIVVIVNSDEESGSFFSREEIIKQALKSKCVLCLEPAPAGNDAGGLKTERYGRSEYTVKIHGRSAHSGNNPHDAINPIIEMSKLIQDIADLENQYEGLISSIVYASSGHTKTALIPGEAEMYLDIRFETYDVGELIHKHLMNMRPHNDQIRLEVIGKIEKPPLTFDERLFGIVQDIGREIGIEMRKRKVGGGSDGNFTSGAGVPTLDGMGMTGEYIHNKNEFIYIENIPARVTILARMIQEV